MSHIRLLPPSALDDGDRRRRRAGAAITVAILLLLIAGLSPRGPVDGAYADDSVPSAPTASPAPTTAGDDSWAAAATAVSTDLDQALVQYRSGNTAGAAAAIQKAHSTGYVASNLGTVIQDNLGQETAAAQQKAFADLRRQAYGAGNEEALATGIDSLKSSVSGSAAQLDALDSLASPRDYAAAREAAVATQRAEIQSSKKQDNKGREGRTWTEVAAEMTPLIDQGVDKAAKGDGRGGAELVNKAYYGYYEKLGFEKTVMAAISGDRVSQVENQFKVVRQAMSSGADISEVRTDADQLKTMLTQDASALDSGTARVSPIKAFFTGSFGQALVILLREGLEAILVVAAVVAYLIKAGMKGRVKFIYAGVLLGLAGSGVVALLFAVLYDSADSHQEILEGVVAIIAMGMLLFTSNWMLSKSSVASWNAYIKDRTEASISSGGFWALASLSFLAVFREGAETVLFYEALFTMDPSGTASIWQGFATGAVCLVIIFLLIRFTSVKIPLRPFFAITSFIMAILVVIFAGGGVHALLEGDIVPASYLPGWPTYDYLGLYPYKQTLAAQAVMAVVVILLLAVSTVRRRREERAEAAVTASSSAPSLSAPADGAADADSTDGASEPGERN